MKLYLKQSNNLQFKNANDCLIYSRFTTTTQADRVSPSEKDCRIDLLPSPPIKLY